jgi:hypothetical protein
MRATYTFRPLAGFEIFTGADGYDGIIIGPFNDLKINLYFWFAHKTTHP